MFAGSRCAVCAFSGNLFTCAEAGQPNHNRHVSASSVGNHTIPKKLYGEANPRTGERSNLLSGKPDRIFDHRAQCEWQVAEALGDYHTHTHGPVPACDTSHEKVIL